MNIVTVALSLLAVAFTLVHTALAADVVRHGGGVLQLLAVASYLFSSIVALAQPTRRLSRSRQIVILLGSLATLLLAGLPPLVLAAVSPAWYIGALGTVATVLAVRQAHAAAWLMVIGLTLFTLVRSGWSEVFSFGAAGAIGWVAIATALVTGLGRLRERAAQFDAARREAIARTIDQNALHVEHVERRRMIEGIAGDMLRRIAASTGPLSPAERTEIAVVEATARDELRGRALLNDAVRTAIRRLRANGAQVRVLDDGGLAGSSDDVRTELLDELAAGLRDLAHADDVVIRSAPATELFTITLTATATEAGEADPTLVARATLSRTMQPTAAGLCDELA